MIPYPHINPIIISFGEIKITWYSVSYVVGILICWYLILQLIKRYYSQNIIKKSHVHDLITWLIIGIVIGGRLGYVFFYDPIKYFLNPIDILKTYMGGMSFHGGLIGCAIASILFAKRNKLNHYVIFDLICATAPIGLFLGRIANFINAELYGRITQAPWGIIFPGGGHLPRHPSQLYEAFLEGILLFGILSIAIHKYHFLRVKGAITALFLISYSIFRIFIEFFREPDIQIGYIFSIFTMGQLLSLIIILVTIYFIFRKKLIKEYNI